MPSAMLDFSLLVRLCSHKGVLRTSSASLQIYLVFPLNKSVSYSPLLI